MFLFFRDPIGEEIADALCRRARNGVAVRVLLNMKKTAMGDPFSTGEKEMIEQDPNVEYDPTDVKPLCDTMAAAGVEVHDTDIDYDTDPSGLDPRLRSIAAQVRSGIAVDELHIDHRKLVIIDERVGWCGGANIGAQYLFHEPFDPEQDAKTEAEARKQQGLSEPWWKWHDSLTRFEGPIVQKLEAQFHDRWVLDGGKPYTPLRGAGDATARGVAARSTTARGAAARGRPIRAAELFCNEPNEHPNSVRELYVRLITEARRSIFIENPYLYHPAIVDALCGAKQLNPDLDIVLVLPAGRHNDNSFSQDAQEHEYTRYLECGIAVYEYQNHFNHLKTAVFDERFSIHGSTNLNYRSLENDKDFELIVLVDDEPLAAWMLEHVRDVDVKHSLRITEQLLRGLDGLRRRIRDPRTMALLGERML
jgi:cardiolipin synthase